MKHHRTNRKLGLERNQRKALLKSLARSLVLRGRIKTTEAKAKEVRGMVEKMVTRGKNATLADRRMLISSLGDATTAQKLIITAEGYKERQGGYTRVIKMGPRKGDAAAMAMLEFV
ncbi:MAG: 50S ribosomal protein L17 [bacterium]|nr:50S ribosomal protein L17 [bacterium]